MQMKILSLAFIFVLILTKITNALPINSDLGLTPYKGETILRTQTRYTLKTDDPTDKNRESEVFVIPFVGVYGFTAKASMLVKIPIVHKELRSQNESNRGDHGLGDITVLGKYRIHTKNFKGGTSRLSLIGGLELPTGEDNETDSMGKLPPPLQLGSGSVDGIVGAAYTYQTLGHEFDSDLRYIFNQEANDFEFGDIFRYNFSYQKRILPVTLPDKGVYSQWNALLELNGVYANRAESLRSEVASSGGHTLFLSPGIQYVGPRLVYESSFQYPILQDLNGDQLETDFVLALSVRYQF